MLSRMLLCAVTALSGPGDAPAAPPPPDAYDVQIRYHINAYRNEHIAQYFEMLRYFKNAGFVRDPDDVPPDDEAEDSRYDRMIGTIPADKARLLLGERHVEVVQLLPKGVKPPADANAPVRVDMQLASGFPPDRQRLLPGQVKAAIADLKFQEAVGYDRRGFTRLLGTVPAGQLDALLSDVRKRPGAPKAPPLRSPHLFWPIRLVEVRPDLPPPAARPEPPAIPKGQEKLTPELRELVGDAKATAPARLEVILARTPDDGERGWADALLQGSPGLVIEGRLGPLVSVRVAPGQAPVLAALPDVTTVRLPRAARPRLETADKVEGWEPLRASGLVRLHLLNRKGQGTRLAVIDGDFSGWRGLVGKQLPEDTRLIDLTRSRNNDLEPDPDPGDGKTLGHGAHMALAVMAAAPEVELVLIRIDPAAPYMLQQVARAINGEDVASENLRNRLSRLDAERFGLDQDLTALLEERRQLFKKFTDVSQKPLLLKKKEKGVLSLDEEAQLDEILKREAYDKKQAEWDQRDKAYHDAADRYFTLIKDLQNLKNVRVVASGLVWNEGHPADASSPLTRYFDDHAFAAALWFQSAGDARGQAWSGLFRDDHGDGVMEFDAPDENRPEAQWRRELDFLSWKPDGGKATLDLPAGARARLSLQWREAHDPDAGRPGEDPYLKPLADLRIVLVYQPDPAGAKQPADDFEVVAQSVGLPQRLEATPSSAVYEQTVELRVTKAGRYAVRIEGAAPTSTRSSDDPTIPAARKMFELHPRLFVETLEGPGRVLLHDFVTEVGTIGMPADSRALLTVGAADSHGLPEPYSAGGPPYDVTLLFKPDLLAYDQVETDFKDAVQGAGVATGFAAGVAAVSRGPTSRQSLGWRESLGIEPGGVVRVPERVRSKE